MTLPSYIHEGIQIEKIQRALLRSANKPLRPEQQDIFDDPHRYKVVACGRRFGKTEVGKRIIVDRAKRGEYCWLILPTFTMTNDIWLALLDYTAGMRNGMSHSKREITFPGKGRLRVMSGSEPERLRGSGLDSIVIDEAAFCDESVWYTLRPSLSDHNGKAVFLSTPNGRNWFWKLYTQGLDPLEPDWRSWQLPTAANPLISAQEIEAARRDLPERQFMEEYLAEFRDDYGSVFRGVLDAAVLPAENRRPDFPGGSYVIGVDWGRYNDFTVLVVIEEQSKCVVAIDRFNQIDWTLQRARLLNLCDMYRPRAVLAEANSIGDINIEELHKHHAPVKSFQTTAGSKQAIIDDLSNAIEKQDIKLMKHDQLIAELQAYEMQHLPGGAWRYNAPSGMHDDCVIALALAWHEVQQGATRRLFTFL